MTGRRLGIVVVILLVVAGYGWWLRLTKGVRALGNADAVVTVSRTPANCSISRNGTNIRHEVPCADVSPYLSEALKLGPGATVGITALGEVAPGTLAAISTDLSAHGFKVA